MERYGQVRVEEVRLYERRSRRGYGIAEGCGAGYYERSRSGGNGLRGLACTVREDGRMKVETKRLGRYARY